jgi:Tfp pilus assembly protein PilO
MRSRYAVWQENWRAWAAPLALVVVAGAALLVYQLRYSGRVAALDSRLERTHAQLASLSARRTELEHSVERARGNREALQALYRGPLGPERDRVTRMIAEVKQLAGRAGMRPDAISYPTEEIKEYNLVKKSVVFGVGGTYDGLRQLIDFLELSSSFLTLEQISLGEASGGASLAIRLQISTLFFDDRPRPAKPSTAVRRPPPAPAAPRPAGDEGP